MVVDECDVTSAKEKSERRNADSRITNATPRAAGQRVDRAAAGGDPLAPPRPRPVERRADAVEADGQRDDQAGLARDEHYVFSAVNFDGHFVTSEFFSPTQMSPCLRTSMMTSRSARNGSGSTPS